MKHNAALVQATRQRAQRALEQTRISEVARTATQIEQQQGCTRTEALRLAERITPHYY